MAFSYCLSAVIAVCLFLAAQAQICYYPSGAIAEFDVPCNFTATSSACCGANAYCFGNGLCWDGVLSRGSCTDRSWTDPVCARYCRNDRTSNGMAISICAMYPVKKYACDVGGDQCDDETNTFEIDTAVRQVVLRPTQLALSIAAAGTSTPPLSSSISSVTSSISPPSISASGASLATNSSNTYTVGALTGVGVGVGLPLLIGLMAALWLYRKERNRNLTLSRREPMVMPPSAYRTTYSYPRGMSNPTRPPYELDGPRTRDGPIHG